MARRKHSKVGQLPEQIVTAVNDRLTEGHTYQEIAEWLTEMGHPIGKSSVGRYAQDWASIATRVKDAQKQAEVLVQELRERPNSDLAEAVEQMLLTDVANALAAGSVDIATGDPVKIGTMVARLQTVGLRREKMKLEFQKEFEAKTAATAESVEKLARKGGVSPDLADDIKKQILGITK